MKKHPLTRIGFIVICFFTLISSCTKDYLEKPVPPKPKVGVQTDSLEASYVTSAITSVNASYWKEADYLQIDNIVNLSTDNLYTEDGRLNLTGTYDGVNDFNDGDSFSIILKAAYDDEYLYLFAEWTDAKIDISQDDWLWNGAADPLKPSNTTSEWTSQRNNDKVAFAFDIDGAATSGNTFSTSGCAVSCHNSGGNFVMGPQSGNVDIWNWSLALSEPFGYAFDMHASMTGTAFDDGQKWFTRNSSDPTDYRKGPLYEWNGAAQNVTRQLGGAAILDAAYFLVNKTSFIGDPVAGDSLYNNYEDEEQSGCVSCHGVNGRGGDGPPFNTAEFSRTYSRSLIKSHANKDEHEGKGYYQKLSSSEANDLIAYIKGFTWVQGYYLEEPTPNESITNVESNSNLSLARVSTSDSHSNYKVMFRRKLDTGYADDVKFEPEVQRVYVFGVALMDNDGKNHIGSLIQHLIFKDK